MNIEYLCNIVDNVDSELLIKPLHFRPAVGCSSPAPTSRPLVGNKSSCDAKFEQNWPWAGFVHTSNKDQKNR